MVPRCTWRTSSISARRQFELVNCTSRKHEKKKKSTWLQKLLTASKSPSRCLSTNNTLAFKCNKYISIIHIVGYLVVKEKGDQLLKTRHYFRSVALVDATLIQDGVYLLSRLSDTSIRQHTLHMNHHIMGYSSMETVRTVRRRHK